MSAALAALSAVVLLLVLEHRRVNLGGRAAATFFLAACGYGWLRSFSIRQLAEAHLADVPYRLEAPLATLVGVPLQELVGWTAAIGLSGYFADRLLRRLGQSTDAYRTTLIAGLCMATICLAVETAAGLGGWWTWNLAHSRTGPLRFPSIALLDWGFVAIDFLLPFELWRRAAPWAHRLASCLLFPLHLAGHALMAPLSGLLPISGFDLAHVGILAAVVGAASAARDASPWPPIRRESFRWGPTLAVAVLLGTATVTLLRAGEPTLLWTAIPLAAIALITLAVRREPQVTGPALRPSAAVWLFLGCLLLGLALRLPAAIRARSFEALLRSGAESLADGRTDAALASLGQSLELRPQHPEALTLLAWAELKKGRTRDARDHLEAALAQRPGSEVAARLMVLLQQQELAREAGPAQ